MIVYMILNRDGSEVGMTTDRLNAASWMPRCVVVALQADEDPDELP